MMLKLLERRECGIDLPNRLFRAESSRRAHRLHLSKYCDVTKDHSAGINSLDLDPVENRQVAVPATNVTTVNGGMAREGAPVLPAFVATPLKQKHYHLLSGGGDGVIVIHDMHNTGGSPQFTYPSVCMIGRSNKYCHKYSVATVQWYPVDTGLFLSSSLDKSLKVWDTNTLVTAGQFQFSGSIYNHHMSLVATSHSLVAVAVSDSNLVHLVDLKSGSKTHTLRGHRKSVMAVRWSPHDEFLLATAGQDSILRFWDIRSAEGSRMLLDQHNGDTSAGPHSVSTAHDGSVNGLTFLPDGLHLLSLGTDETLRLWDTQTGRNKLVNYGRIANKRRSTVKFAVSHDASASVVFVPSDGNVEVYDIFSGDHVSTLRGHYNQVNCCFYNTDAHELYSGANDRNILIWLPETASVSAYEDFVNSTRQSTSQNRTKFTSRVVGTADNWSSDED